MTREWPPDVYGGAGVHVEFLARELARLVDVDVQAFAQHGTWDRLADAHSVLQVLATDLSLTASAAGVDVVHSHTWYANLAGHLAKLLYGVPHVMTSHSLEPLRPWKAEQLGGGYAVSSWVEKTAVEAADAGIAGSRGRRGGGRGSSRAGARACGRRPRQSPPIASASCTTASTPSCSRRDPTTASCGRLGS